MAEGCSSVVSSRRRTLECSICLEKFRDPKTLPCLHSFCLDCLINYAPQGTETLNCPLCKEEIEIPEKDVSNFKSNFHLKELVDEACLTDKVTNSATDILCNCCDEEVSAVSRCLDCDQYLCNSCLKVHKRFPALRDHVIANFDEIKAGKVRPRSNLKRQLMCVKHAANKAEIFCTTCEIPICHVCSSLKHKDPEHECIETVEAVDAKRNEVIKNLETLSEVKELFINAIAAVEGEIEESILHATSLKRDIDLKSQRLVAKIESDKKTLLKEIDQIVDKDKQELAKRKSSAEVVLSNIESAFKEGKPIAEDSSDADFLSLHATLESKLQQLCMQKPEEYKKYIADLSFRQNVTAEKLSLGYIIQGRTIRLKLDKEYKGDGSSAHKFYSVVIGRQFTSMPHILAVTDKITNEVVVLNASTLSKQQKIRSQCSYDKQSDSKPIYDIAFSASDLFCYLYVVNHSGEVEIFAKNFYDEHFNICGKSAIDTEGGYAMYEMPSIMSVVAYQTNNIIVGKTTTPCHHSLVQIKVSHNRDSGTVVNSMRIPINPCFLSFTTNYADLIVSDTYAGKVQVLGKDGKIKSVLETELSGQHAPTGVCCDESGCIYVASLLYCHKRPNGQEVKSTICKYAPTGRYMASLGEFDHPVYGIVLTKEGKLAAACGDSVKLFVILDD